MFHASRLLKGTVLMSLLLLSSCTFLDELKNNLSGKDSGDVQNDDSYGYKATESLSRYVDLLNAGHDNVSSLEDNLSYLENDILSYDPSAYEPYFYCYFDYNSYDTTLISDLENPIGLTAEEASSFSTQASAIVSTLDQLKAICEDINRHVSAREYKNDEFAALNGKMDEAYTLIESYYAAHNNLLDEVNVAFETYDTWEVDPSDPVSVGIDNMDKDMDKAYEILRMIDDNYIAGVTDGVSTQIQPLYEALFTVATEHSALETTDSVSYYYEDFYDELDQTFLPIVKRTMNNFDAADLDSVDLDYSDLLDSYNHLVDDYNYYIDYSAY